jgi:hypothetical protein
MKIISACVLILSLCGCALFTPERVVINEPRPFYSQAETDAINAEIQCKNLARNSVQVARCSTRR